MFVTIWVFVFFFQAEDGIRDLTVTGVQTCALPISRVSIGTPFTAAESRTMEKPICDQRSTTISSRLLRWNWLCWSQATRSEERRVGKECRSGWTPNL